MRRLICASKICLYTKTTIPSGRKYSSRWKNAFVSLCWLVEGVKETNKGAQWASIVRLTSARSPELTSLIRTSPNSEYPGSNNLFDCLTCVAHLLSITELATQLLWASAKVQKMCFVHWRVSGWDKILRGLLASVQRSYPCLFPCMICESQERKHNKTTTTPLPHKKKKKKQ